MAEESVAAPTSIVQKSNVAASEGVAGTPSAQIFDPFMTMLCWFARAIVRQAPATIKMPQAIFGTLRQVRKPALMEAANA
ncbi:MAG: hypothetical protein OXG29_08565 [Gammaproteobacteria bacterium]|nr:hypothetical protein [Gammaproteobacteria bacterium]